MLKNELDGLLVVSLEQAVAAPYCGLLLADAGARVIKVERPEGDFARGYDAGANGQSTIFAWLNRGKESVVLDLKEAGDLALLTRMLARADVLLVNLAPGVLARLGLESAALRRDFPGLIICSISGYGESGLGARKKAYDFLIQAESGLCSVTGGPESPARVGVSLTDISTGLTAFSAILRALIQRGRTGEGGEIKISMFDVLADWMNMPLLAHRYMGGAPERMGLKHSFIAPYGAFDCGDGGKVLLSIQNNREFAKFCDQIIGDATFAQDPRFSENPARFANRVALDALVTEAFAPFTLAEVVAKLDAAGIANARLNSVADLSGHPFLQNSRANIGGTEIEMAALPVSANTAICAEVPTLDQHGRALRVEFAKPD